MGVRSWTSLNAKILVTLTDVLIRRSKKTDELSDDELMKLVCRGDEGAFRALYERYRRQIFIYCLRLLRDDRDLAMDAMQDIFIRVHKKRDRYSSGTNFAGWIHTIARNICLNFHRDAPDYVSFDEMTTLEPSYEETERDVGLRDQLTREIDRLPEAYREVLILREYEERTYQEIVDITGLPMSTVKFRIFKAREVLRERLQWGLDELNSND